ncbi:MAG: serine/threonine protein kinase [bacterium]|nr:serine/threonine protein kinase [bacterium]
MADPRLNPANGVGPTDVRFGQVLNDFLDRRRRGESVDETEFFAGYPEFADELSKNLALLQDLQPAHAHIDRLIELGILSRSTNPDVTANLGSYIITGFLGRGGMGVVLKAHEPSLNRTVALKILRPELATDTAALARFEREAKAAAALEHPNIVTVYTVGQEQDVHYLAMEYVGGPTLADVIREGVGAEPQNSELETSTYVASPLVGDDECPSSLGGEARLGVGHPNVAVGVSPAEDGVPVSLHPETIRHLFRQLLEGLNAAHQAGLIHRDIKPSNLLLDCGLDRAATRNSETEGRYPELGTQDSPILKIGDFGLARMLSSQTRLTLPDSTPGTPEYMSTEQARGDDEIDHRTDLYSAGVVLYEMLTGRTPFKADTPSALIHQILHNNPPAPRSINKDADPHMASLAQRLLAKQRDDRFESAADVLAALDARSGVRLPERRRRIRRVVLGGLLTLAIMAVGGWQSRAFRPFGDESRIREVRVELDSDGSNGRVLEARFGDSLDWSAFHEFPPDVEHVSGAALVDAEGNGRRVIVAGVFMPLRGDCVFAYDQRGDALWSIGLSSSLQWPDCPPPTQFRCVAVRAADLDGIAGDELIIAAGDYRQYPTRITLVDPRNQKTRSTFWHFGDLPGLLISADFFGPDRPAIIAWGKNNKLDGFDDALPNDTPRVADWDCVDVVMILDPADLSGVGPPGAGRAPGIPAAHIHAYAFLNLPYNQEVRHVSSGQDGTRILSRPVLEFTQTGGIVGVTASPRQADDGTGPWFELDLTGVAKDGTMVPRAFLTVDRNLELRLAVRRLPENDTHADRLEYWGQYWRPIGQPADSSSNGDRADPSESAPPP